MNEKINTMQTKEEILRNNLVGLEIIGDKVSLVKEYIYGAMQEYADQQVNKNDSISNVMPFLGTAKLIKNNTGHSSIKNVTIGRSYQIIEKLDRSRSRKYRPNMNDGFWIINDAGKKVAFTNQNLWDVNWV